MSRSCCIMWCDANSYKLDEYPITYHLFPPGVNERIAWMKIVCSKKAWKPPIKDIESLYVCSRHFTSKDFKTTQDGPRTLKKMAVPSVFPTSACLNVTNQTNLKRPNSEMATTIQSSNVKKVCTASMKELPISNTQPKIVLERSEISANVLPPNRKHIVVTDKYGRKLLLLTAPVPQTSATIQKIVTTISESKKPAFSKAQSVQAKPAANLNSIPMPSTSTKSPAAISNAPSTALITSSDKVDKDSTLMTDSSDCDSNIEEIISQTTSEQSDSFAAARKNIKSAANESRKLNNRKFELKLFGEMALMKRELLKKTLQLTQMGKLVERLKKDRAIAPNSKKTNMLMKSIRVLQKKAEDGDHSAIFLMEQILGIDRNPRFSESTLECCTMWRNVSKESYDFAQELSLLKLPSAKAIQTFLGEKGKPKLDNGNKDLQKRFEKLLVNLSEIQKVGSLIVQSIHSSNVCTKGSGDENVEKDMESDDKDERPAIQPVSSTNKLNKFSRYVVFKFVGLDLPEPIMLGRHCFKDLKNNDKLKILTLQMCEDIEKMSLKVVRIVSDASLESMVMFGIIGGGESPIVSPQVMNPVVPSRPLYLTCDYIDVLRRLRLQFISENQKLSNDEKPISKLFIRKLYGLKFDEGDPAALNLPTRRATLRKLSPNCRLLNAINIFSPAISVALRMMKDINEDFQNSSKTIEFLEIIYAWCVVQDICNSSPEHLPDGLSIEDKFLHAALLEWLEVDFLGYLEAWRQTCSTPDTQFLNAVNYGTLRLTTLAAVLYVRYLLESKFRLTNPKQFSEATVNSVVGHIIDQKKCRHLDPETITLVASDEQIQLGVILDQVQVVSEIAENDVNAITEIVQNDVIQNDVEVAAETNKNEVHIATGSDTILEALSASGVLF